MNAEQKELFRKAILQLLDCNRTRYGVGIVWIAARLPEKGFTRADFDDTENFFAAIADELQYLEDKKLIEEALKAISPENRAWRITREGIAFVDRNH